MELYICEKPSQAKDLAAVLGVKGRGDGCIRDADGGRVITWAIGHLLEQFMPQEYDERYKSWDMALLPIMPAQWKYKVKGSVKKQFNIIEKLVKMASLVYVATDLDREGEAIARSILERVGYRGEIKRVGLRSLDEDSIRKALSNVRPGHESLPLYYASLARQRADWLIGMNMSRLYSKLAEMVGYKETLHVGRVITPTVALVCQRDRDIAQFKPSPFYVLTASVQVQQGAFYAQWLPPEEVSDEHKRCINKAYAEQVARQVKGKRGVIEHAETKRGKESAPLPFCITSLQKYAGNKWGYTAQQTLDGAQALYETHKATTYPRTDSRYLPTSQRADIPKILQSLLLSDQSISGVVAGADPERKSRAFNDAKVNAHHAIIPTLTRTDVSKMSELEFNLYDAIRRHYLAQFYAPFEFNKTQVRLNVEGHLFNATGKVPVKQGWRILFTNDIMEEEDNSNDEEQAESNNLLPPMRQGEPAAVADAALEDKTTRAPPHFTESTLLDAMSNIARYVDEPKFKATLKESDGIGTGATRAGTIEGAVDRGYLVRKKKLLIASDKAHALVAILPPALKSAGLTALWEQQLQKIVDGELDLATFMNQMNAWVTNIVVKVRENSHQLTENNAALAAVFAKANGPIHSCFTCGTSLKRIKGQKGFFWACTSTNCKETFPDQKGKPAQRQAQRNANGPSCPECSKPMRELSGKKPGAKRKTKFWGCTGYPDCKHTITPAEAKKRM